MAEMVYPAPAKLAASLLAIRSGAHGLEVLMVRRGQALDFAPGMWVFPGGRVNPQDGLGERALRIAALRELFEETGLVCARDEAGRWPSESQRGTLDRRYRARVTGDRLAFGAMLRQTGLSARPKDLAPFAHWITPEPVPKRFDTRFYVTRAPRGQRAVVDGSEAVALAWVRPADMLARQATGEAALMFPTRLILEKLKRGGTVPGALALARRSAVVPVMPKIAMANGQRTVTIPEAAGYGVTHASHIDAEMRGMR